MRMTNRISTSAKALMESCSGPGPSRHLRYVLLFSFLLRRMVLCGALLSASQLFATSINPLATPCVTTTLDVLVTDGSVGCTIGGEFDAANFSFSATGTGALAANQITVTPNVTTLGGVVVLIDFNFSGNFSNANGTAPQNYAIGYTLDPPLPVILGAQLALDPGGTLTENICAGGMFSGSSCLPNTAFLGTVTITGSSATIPFPSAVTTVDYQLSLGLPAGAATNEFASASVTGVATPTPEPSSIFLLASGLLALRSFRKRQPSS